MSSTFICKDTTRIFLGKLPTSWHGRNLNLRGLACPVVVGVARSVAFESSLGVSGFKFRRGVLSRQPGTIPLRLGSQLERAAAPGRAGPGYGLGTPRAKCRPVLGACGRCLWAVPAAAGDPAPLAPQAEAEARAGSAAACPGPVAPAGLARRCQCQRALLVPAGQLGTGWARFTLPVAVVSRPKSMAAGMAMIPPQDAASGSSPSQRTYQNLPAPGA